MADGIGWLAGASFISSIGSAFSQVQAGKMNRAVADFNASMSRLKARDARFRGQQEIAKHGMGVAQLKGQQRAAMAAQGIDVSAGGTVDEALDDTQYWATIDRVTMQNNIIREAFGFEQDAVVTQAEGRRANNAGRQQAIGSIVGGGISSASLYYQGTR